MDIVNPVPVAAALLLIALPGVLAAGVGLAARVTDRPWVLGPGLALAMWLIAMHAIAVATGSYLSGLVSGTIVISAIGVAQSKTVLALPRNANVRMLAGAAIAVAAIAYPAVVHNFHDELLFTGHMSIATSIENDFYPPRNLSLAQYELRYHFFFNLLCASMQSMLRLNPVQAIDAATLGLWGYSWCVLWALGERLFSRGWPTAAIVLFSGGLPFWCVNGVHKGTPLLGVCFYGPRLGLNPPLVSYFFQHPWSVGLPLAACVLLLLADRERTANVWRWVAYGVLFIALPQSQIVLAATVIPTAVATELLLRRQRGLPILVAFAAVPTTVGIMRGFLAPSDRELFLQLHLGVGDDLSTTVWWFVQTFGLLIPAGLIGLKLMRGHRVAYGLLIAGSFVVLNSVRYQLTWDIVKFGTVLAIALAICASGLVTRLGRWAPIATATLIAPGVIFVGVFWFADTDDLPRDFWLAPTVLAPAEVSAVNLLRRNVRPGDVVYRSDFSVARGYAQWGGLPQALPDALAMAKGFPRSVIDRRKSILESQPPLIALWLGENIRWLVLSPEDTRLHGHVRHWTRAGQAKVVGRYDDLVVIALSDRPRPP